MSKKPTKKSALSKKQPSSKVIACIKVIREAYRDGKRLLKQYERALAEIEKSGGKNYDRKVIEQLAEESGLNADVVRKRIAFAESYSVADLKRLVTLLRKHNYAMGESHIHRLLSIKNRQSRNSLEREAAENHWSRRQLDQAISTKTRAYERGGRKPVVSPPRERLAKIRSTAKAFCHLVETGQSRDESGKPMFDHLKLGESQLDSVTRAYRAIKRMLAELDG